MRAIYRTSFELRAGAQSGDLFDAFSETTWRWLFDRRELGLPSRPVTMRGPVTTASAELSFGFRAESLHVETNERRGWSLLVSQKDSQEPELVWVSDIALLRETDGSHHFSFTQSLGRQDGGMMPIRRRPGRPRIIGTLVRNYIAASGGLRLHSKPIALRLSDENIRQFISLLERPERTHPIVLVSIHEQSGRPLINTGELADHLSGIAHVVAAESAAVSAALSRALPRWLTCFDGAVRVYWPGFRRASRTIDHRLWTAEDLAAESIKFDSGRFADLMLATIAAVSVNSTSPRYCSFDKLQSLDRRRIIAAAKDNKDWQELANAYFEDCEAKDAHIDSLERELKDVSESYFREQQFTATLKAALEERKAGRAAVAEEQLPVTSVADSIARARESFSTQLAFALNSKSNEHSPYRYPEEVWLAFEWLATTYFQAKMKTLSCPDLDASVGEAVPGWTYSGHQNESTMKAHDDWYRCSYCGNRLWIPEHLKSGTSRDAEDAIRIAFAWEPTTKKVVLGFIGQHQKNAHSN